MNSGLRLSPWRFLRHRRVQAARRLNQPFVGQMRGIGAKMLVAPVGVFCQAYVVGSYEAHVVKYLRKHLKPGMTCLDIGANVGYFTLLMSKMVQARGSVFAFEPTERTYQALCKNIELNNFSWATPVRIALSDREGSIEFHEGPPGFEVYNSAGKITHPSAAMESFTINTVPCQTLDHYVEEHRIPRIDFIKIDVEGSELFVLKGMEKTLKLNAQAKVVIEFSDQTTQGFNYLARETGVWLAKRGWCLFRIRYLGGLSPVSHDQPWSGQMLVASRS